MLLGVILYAAFGDNFLHDTGLRQLSELVVMSIPKNAPASPSSVITKSVRR
jgi:hypothetical protein